MYDKLCSKRDFDVWHFAMLNDEGRNQLIQSCISELNLRGKTVFEIGTGVGLTALLFAVHGASKVITCEINSQLYEIAIQLVHDYGYENRIFVYNRSSTDIVKSGIFLNAPPDIVFTETLDCGIIGEGFKAINEDINAVTAPHTIVLPHKIEQLGCLVECADLAELNRVTATCGFDVSYLNKYSTQTYFPVRLTAYQPKALSPVHKIRTISYQQRKENGSKMLIHVKTDGICHGLVTFFYAYFGEHVVSNETHVGSHWHQAFHPVREPIHVRSQRSYVLKMCYDGAVKIYEDN